jgi:ribosomal protein S18 acetylase RimI-like enzyme
MVKVETTDAVFAAMQQVRTNAPAYCTNFFPVPQKLQRWIEQGELFMEVSSEVAFFFKGDREFWHLYFCAAKPETLRRQLQSLPALKTEHLVIDMLESKNSTEGLLPLIASVGFRCHARLCRLTRTGSAHFAPNPSGDLLPVYAAQEDAQGIFEILESSFDRYAEQLPKLFEIQMAVENHQILVMKQDQTISGLLFFETQGAASTIRYWLVPEKFRALHFGSALMRAYFAAHGAIRRFTLWVMADNENALQKYRHYGYTPDGVTDHVLVNEIIHHEISH